MEEGDNWLGRTINKLTQKKPEEKDSREKMQELRQELIAVNKSAEKYANSSRSDYIGEEGKPFLPNTLILKNVGNRYDLVSTAHLRAEELWGSDERVFPEANDQMAIDRYIWQDGDNVSVPKKFLKQGSYITLFIPKYSAVTHEKDRAKERIGNRGYDITVLYCQNQNTLLKLMSFGELSFRQNRKVTHSIRYEPEFFREFTVEPLPHPKKEEDFYPALEIITLQDNQENVPIWFGNRARFGYGKYEENTDNEIDQLKKHYEMTVNGSICYRLEIGSVQPKRAVETRAETEPAFVTQPSV